MLPQQECGHRTADSLKGVLLLALSVGDLLCQVKLGQALPLCDGQFIWPLPFISSPSLALLSNSSRCVPGNSLTAHPLLCTMAHSSSAAHPTMSSSTYPPSLAAAKGVFPFWMRPGKIFLLGNKENWVLGCWPQIKAKRGQPAAFMKACHALRQKGQSLFTTRTSKVHFYCNLP